MKAISTGIFLLTLVISPCAYAAPEAINLNAAKCGMAYEKCYAECRQEQSAQTLKGDTSRAICGSICVAKRTACMAGEGYDKARPWVTDKIEMFNKFLDNFLSPPLVIPKVPKGGDMKNI